MGRSGAQSGAKTKAEHPIAGEAAKYLNLKYVYRKALSIIVHREVAVAKTVGDVRFIKAVKAGAMGAQELAERSKANFVKAVATRWAQAGSSTAEMLRDAKQVAQPPEESAPCERFLPRDR